MFKDELESIYKEIESNNNQLIVVFGGLAGKLPIPVFEFLRSLDRYKIDKIFIRDLNQTWYQNGIYGYTNNYQDSLLLLKNMLSIKKYNRITFIGNSSGGYASLLYGNLLKINQVIAFSPQTFLGNKDRKKNGDYRWNEIMNSINNLKIKTILEVKDVIKKSGLITQNNIYYSQNDDLDKLHAERLVNLPNVNLTSYPIGDHSVIKDLKANGELDKILDRLLI